MHSKLWIALLTVVAVSVAPAVADEEKITTDEEGHIHVQPVEVDERFRNSDWPEDMEEGFWRRATHVIEHFRGANYGNTWQENEKAAYAKAMTDFLAGNRQRAVNYLQGEDAQAGTDHAHTEGIDFYWCFTLKNQVRKYFFFGQHLGALDDEYMQRMRRGAETWTQRDPKYHEHPRYGRGDRSKPGWGPEKFGSWVDVRNTDNLRAMRDTSVYLFAEETGNEETRQLYKEKIREYVTTLYHMGMGEWDSENYHAHTLMPYLNLYDFAQDPEVRMLAKAACDWLTTAGALKYYRGGFGGPTKRDYGGGNRVFGAGVTHAMALYFDDTVMPDPNPHYDDFHAITSAYRPPLAVAHLARKNFPRPLEMHNTKPYYENWKEDQDDEPLAWETLFFGETYYLGTCVSKFGIGDVGPFKLLAENSERGVDYVIAYTGDKYNTKRGGDQMGQYRNLLVYLRPADEPFGFMLPGTAEVDTDGDIWFVEMEKTYLAIRPINLESPEQFEPGGKTAQRYGDELWLRAGSTGDGLAGFAMEVGEEPEYGDFESFRNAVRRKQRLDLSELGDDEVTFVGTGGRELRMRYNRENDLPVVIRDGRQYEWMENFDLYEPVEAEGPVSLGWKEGTLEVRAGGYVFTQTVTEDGEVTFSERKIDE
ncbi:MAG: hypothetical protein ACP5HU_07550 [Phycisphaerae bacterium]